MQPRHAQDQPTLAACYGASINDHQLLGVHTPWFSTRSTSLLGSSH
ncbi:hypothetical protein DB30_04427 [Enhygromyxa salina]|uniref:Uncharacterized protein n=1 Tax=Enhygromyxa salina TaxID=215803 RepID=A0A0C1ZFT1_9BACT|nr:hypothetical protein DB30_04427 [Enhygromyxa salina]